MSYIYIRESQQWDSCKTPLCKLGYTCNIKDRSGAYITCEPQPGKFTKVWKLTDKNSEEVESYLKRKLSDYNVYTEGGGTEFFKKEIKDLIEGLFQELETEFKLLTEEEIDTTIRVKREYASDSKSISEFNFWYGQKEAYKEFERILSLSTYWGLLIAPTGWGKSMMYYLFIGLFFRKFQKNVIFITKRKDILQSVVEEIKKKDRKIKKTKYVSRCKL